MPGRKESQELFQLVKSMSPEEKGYFVKYAQRHSTKETETLRLFKAIDKQETFNEQELRKEIKHLPVQKAALVEQLLEALTISNQTPTISQQVLKNINYSEILYARGMPQKALTLARETYQMAIENDLIEAALLVQLTIENMTVGTLTQNERWQAIHQYHETSDRLAEDVKKLSKYFFEERKMVFIIRENDRTLATKLLDSIDIKFLEKEANATIPRFKFSRTTSLLSYYYASGCFDKMYRVSKEGLENSRKTYLKNPSLARAHSYMVALFNHQDVALESGDLDGVLDELKHLEDLRIHSKPLDDVIIRFHSIRMQQEVYFLKGEFEKGFKYSLKVFESAAVDKKANFHPHIYEVLLAQQSVLALLSKHYKAAYLSLQKLLSFAKKQNDVLQEASIHFVEAIIHFESGDVESFKKQIRFIEKFNIQKKHDLQPLIELLKQAATGDKTIICAESFVLFHRIVLNDWFKSMAGQQSLSEIVSERNKAIVKARRKKAKLK